MFRAMTALKMTGEERHTQRRLWGKRLHEELHGRPDGPDCSREGENNREFT
jgi:hypothetical protein